MSTAPTASMGLLTSSRQQPRRDDDIGSLCRNASPSRKGAFSSSVVVSANAQHARFIATTIYRTCGIVVTSARLTTHSSGPSSFYPTLGVCLGPNRPRRCRRGGRSSIIGDAWISEGRRSVPRPHITSTASRVVLQPLIGRDALNSIQATPQTQRPLAVAAVFHRTMAAATGDQVSGGSPRPRPRPPEIRILFSQNDHTKFGTLKFGIISLLDYRCCFARSQAIRGSPSRIVNIS